MHVSQEVVKERLVREAFGSCKVPEAADWRSDLTGCGCRSRVEGPN